MTDTTSVEAWDAALAVLKTAWEKVGSVTENLELRYWDTGSAAKRAAPEPIGGDQAEAYGLVAVEPLELLDDVLGGRSQRHTTTEIMTVGIFTPLGDGGLLERQIRDHLIPELKSHVGSVNGITFIEIVPRFVGEEGAHKHLNILASYQYQTRVLT